MERFLPKIGMNKKIHIFETVTKPKAGPHNGEDNA